MAKKMKTSALPDLQIPVNGTLWEVFRISPKQLSHMLGNNNTPAGITDFANKRIFIRHNLSPLCAKETLFHELLHSAMEANIVTKDSNNIEVELAAELGIAACKAVMANVTKIESFLKQFSKTPFVRLGEDDVED